MDALEKRQTRLAWPKQLEFDLLAQIDPLSSLDEHI
jgi:hypothetical protein